MEENLSCKVYVKSGLRFEDVVSQLQAETLTILCVRNGYELITYKLHSDLPSGLSFEHKANGCYWYRLLATKDMYAFFLSSVHYYLLQQEEQYYLRNTFAVQILK